MQTILATALAAAVLASLTFGATAAVTLPGHVLKPVNSHLGMHLVCKDDVHNHRQIKVCTWVKDK